MKTISVFCYLAALGLILALAARGGFFDLHKKSWADPQLGLLAGILIVAGTVTWPKRKR